MKNIAIFASGTGTNAEKIIAHFAAGNLARVVLVVCNKPGAGVVNVAARAGLPVLMIEKEEFFRGEAYLSELMAKNVDFIVLAGFLWKVPGKIVKAFPERIVNIHPALLPKYGGKGMYGHKVHEAVIAAGESESGISIHYVNEIYDDGKTILQLTCPVTKDDDPDTLAAKVHALEHANYPIIIEKLIAALD
jgi:phosphoribosylglycinamide formyltransferase 1